MPRPEPDTPVCFPECERLHWTGLYNGKCPHLPTCPALPAGVRGITEAEHDAPVKALVETDAPRRLASWACPSVPLPEEFTAFLLHDTLPNGWTRYQDGAISKQNEHGITFIWRNGTVTSRLF